MDVQALKGAGFSHAITARVAEAAVRTERADEVTLSEERRESKPQSRPKTEGRSGLAHIISSRALDSSTQLHFLLGLYRGRDQELYV